MRAPGAPMKHSWDIFCSVVDNYGDAGVCWRLARQLATELGQDVRLWVDDLATLQRILPVIDPDREAQCVSAVEIRRWSKDFAATEIADIVIEAFGVRLPEAYVAAMAERRPQPAWINLEYLSAEHWVEGCHGLPSPHPVLPLTKYFYFPGFTPATGGLLIEDGLMHARAAYQEDVAAIPAFWRVQNIVPPDDGALRVSMFCYGHAPLASLVHAWATGDAPVACIAPEGVALAELSRIVGEPLAPGACVRRGQLAIHAAPFLALDAYDRLLWSCDINFVRGEDSFVRAQLAARPLVWHAYPQEGAAEFQKISAFLERYSPALEPEAQSSLAACFEAWNRGSGDMGEHWGALRGVWPALSEHAHSWALQLAAGGNLARNLADFCENRLK